MKRLSPFAPITREQFIARTDRTGPCWIWQGTPSHAYGVVQHEGRQHRANRLSYLLFVGSIPEGMCVLHRCDTPRCVRPDHLFLGTQADNMADMAAKGRARQSARRAVGTSHGLAKLSDDVVREARSRFTAGESIRGLARAFGVGRSTMGRVLHGQTWTHVAGGSG